MPRQEFHARLESWGSEGAMTLLRVPFDVEKEFGSKEEVKVSLHVHVAGTLNGFPFRSSIDRIDGGAHVMFVDKALQQRAKARQGDRVKVVMELDTGPYGRGGSRQPFESPKGRRGRGGSGKRS